MLILMRRIMKLLLLLPVLALMAVSGYNLYNELAIDAVPGNLAIIVLHTAVTAMCLFFTGLIIRSMFTIKYVERERPVLNHAQDYEELTLQQSA